ncbi:MAG: Trm112 family protein [Terracoccus sp.]
MNHPTHPGIDSWLREILRCPQCKGELTDAGPSGGSAVAAGSEGTAGAELHCGTCSLAYPIENGVPVLLIELAHPIEA